MKILLLSPQPFFQERGTTIAIDLLLKALSERGDETDLLTFHLGEDRSYPGVTITRIRPPFAPASIKPGLSWKKVYCDLFLLRDAFRMIRSKRYHLIHAVEEAGFIAMVVGKIFRVPFVLDMDSSLSAQILDQSNWARPVGRLLRWFETLPIRRAIAVVPMCENLAVLARRHSSGIVHVLKDVSLITEAQVAASEILRAEFGIDGPMLMYVGNLEPYQGIDLLLDCFVQLRESHPDAELVIIGGSKSDIRKYQDKACDLGIDANVHLLGSRPVAALAWYLKQADILISPRIKGTNTPMKIYSYLDSGVAVVATALPTHTQVMTDDEAALTPPEPAAMAATIADLLDDAPRRQRVARNAQRLIRREHSWDAFRKNVDQIFGELEACLELNR